MKKSASALFFTFLMVGVVMASGVVNGNQCAAIDNDWVTDTVAVWDDDTLYADSVYDDEVDADEVRLSCEAGELIHITDSVFADLEFTGNADGMSVNLTHGNANASPELTIPSEVDDGIYKCTVIAIDGNAFCADADGVHPLSGVKHIYISDGVMYVGKHAFAGAPDLESVRLPSSLKRIPEGMFLNCKKLKTIEFPDDSRLETIEKHAFAGCTSLEHFHIPASVTEIKEAVWKGCTSLTEISLEEGSDYFMADQGVLYDCREGAVLQYPAAKRGQRYEVLFGSVKVGKAAFSGNPYIEEVKLPVGIDMISEGAFRDCASLRKVELAGELSDIRSHAFEQCPNLAGITLYGATYFSESFDAHTKVVTEPQVPSIQLPQSGKGILASVFDYVSTSSLLQTAELFGDEDYGFPASFGKGRWAVYGNSSPRKGVQKVLDAIPSNLLAIEYVSEYDKMLRIYLDKSNALHPKLLFFVGGTKGNDLVVAFFEDGNLQAIEKEIAKQKKKFGI